MYTELRKDGVVVAGKKRSHEENYSLGYTHWWHLKDLPIVVEKEAVFFDDRLYWNEDHTKINKDYEPEKLKSTVTLYDLFHSIFSELCWNGSPDKRTEFMNKIKERSQEVEDHPENLVELDMDELFKRKKM